MKVDLQVELDSAFTHFLSSANTDTLCFRVTLASMLFALLNYSEET